MSCGHVGGQDATNSDTLQVVSLFSRHPASYCVFLLEWFNPACPPSREWWGSGSPTSAPCVTAPRQKVEDRDRHSVCTLLFFLPVHGSWELDVMKEWGIKPHSSGTGQGEGRSCDGMLSSRVVWSGVGIGPYDPSTAGTCQRLPSIPQECLHFTRLIQGDACHPLPQPGPIQPSGPAWFLLQAGERHGNAGAGMLTRRHAPALAHTHASSLLLPALPCMLFLLSVLLSSLRSTKDLVKASGSSVL